MPRQVALAVNLLVAIVALAVVNLILGLAQPGVSVASIAGVGSIVSIALYASLAFMIRKGANWARIVITVLFALSILPLLFTLLLPVATVFKVLTLVWLAIEIAVLVLLWRAPSSAYFAAHSRPV